MKARAYKELEFLSLDLCFRFGVQDLKHVLVDSV